MGIYLYAHANPVNGADPSGHMNLSTVMFSTPFVGAAATRIYVNYGVQINRAVVILYEAVSDDIAIASKGIVVGSRTTLSKVDGGLASWIKAITDAGKGVTLAPYGYLKELMKRSGWDANHLNQSAAFKKIDELAGAAVDLVGGAFSNGAEHNQFHLVMVAYSRR